MEQRLREAWHHLQQRLDLAVDKKEEVHDLFLFIFLVGVRLRVANSTARGGVGGGRAG